MRNILTTVTSSTVNVIRALNVALGGDVTFWTISDEQAATLTNMGMSAMCIQRMISGPIQDKALRVSAGIISAVTDLSSKGEIAKAALEAGCPEASAQWLNTNMSAFLYNTSPNIIAITEALNSIELNAIIVHNDVDATMRPLAEWGRAHDVPVIHIPHAIYLPNAGRGPIFTDVHDFPMATHLCAAGPYQASWYKERYNKLGIKAQIRVTGLPQYDRLSNVQINRERACRLLGNLDPRWPVVTYFSSWRQDTNLLGCHNGIEETYVAFLTAASRLPDCHYIIKLHPNDARTKSEAWHVEQAEKAGIKCVVTASNLDAVLNCTNLAISYGNSNVLLEAACIPGIRLMQIGDPGMATEIFNVKFDVDLIEEAIASVLSHPAMNTKRLISTFLGDNDGMNTKRITEWILKLI